MNVRCKIIKKERRKQKKVITMDEGSVLQQICLFVEG
jgi:hypothetical protein